MNPGTSERFNMLYCHSKDCQFVQFSGHGAAHRDHAGQLRYVSIHFITSSLLYFAMVLPAHTEKNSREINPGRVWVHQMQCVKHRSYCVNVYT